MNGAHLGKDVDLAFPLVHVIANMVHGRPLPSCGVGRGMLLWSSLCHHVKREASRFIPSVLSVVKALLRSAATENYFSAPSWSRPRNPSGTVVRAECRPGF